MRRITSEDVPLKFDFDRWSNSYEVRNNKGFLIEMLKNDYDAVKYLTEVIGIPKKEAEQIVKSTFFAGVSKPLI
jgi:hypothetical protein